jgi:hypothetical protein
MNLTQQLGYQVNFSGRFDSTAGLIFNRFNHLQINQVSCFTWLKELNRRVLTSIRILKYRTCKRNPGLGRRWKPSIVVLF